jgi:hypothetical protein
MQLPILLTILYVCFGGNKASLRIRGNNEDADLALTIIHEGTCALTQRSIAGNGETDAFTAQNKETIIILARRDSITIGSAVFQVDTALPAITPLILRPCTISNTDIDQCEFGVTTRAAQRVLDAVFAEHEQIEEGAQLL